MMTTNDKKSGLDMNINEEDIEITTMADDLNAKAGKIPEKKPVSAPAPVTPARKEVSNISFFGDSKPAPAPVKQNSSPFLSEAPRNVPSSSDMRTAQSAPVKPSVAPTQNVPIKTAPAPAALPTKEAEKKSVITSIPEKTPIKMGLNWKMITISAVVLLILLAGGGGGYYYWMTRQVVAPPVAVVEEPIVEPVEEQPLITVPDSKFSEDLPNYLNIDVETSNVESIKALLLETAQEVNDSGLKKAVEFSVRDKNNNPIAFTRFAYIFQLNLSASVLINMEEDFSLFFYNDNGKMRLGLAAELLNKEEAIAGLTKEEKTIVKSFTPLFLGEVLSDKEIKFTNGKYGEQATRYVNLNADNSASFDYAIVGKKLVIGTSMMTARAIIDKIAAERAVAPATSTAPAASTPIENQTTSTTTGAPSNTTDCPEGTDCAL